MLASALDSVLNRPAARAAGGWGDDTRVVDTHAGRIRVRDTGAPRGKSGPVIVMPPDGPNATLN